MSVVKEFKEFALKGSVVDLAVGIIIGGAFGKIVTSLVNDVIMPPIGVILGGVDFSSLSFRIREATTTAPAVNLRYGLFINNIIDFFIVAFSIFMMIRAMNALRKKQDAPAAIAAPTVKECPECSMSIPIKAKRCGHCQTTLS
ncbi:MAG: large-conductance mechanosensitive channel protein MscL [Bacteroidota bacterium]